MGVFGYLGRAWPDFPKPILACLVVWMDLVARSWEAPAGLLARLAANAGVGGRGGRFQQARLVPALVLAAGALHKLSSSSSRSSGGSAAGTGTGSSRLTADRSCIEWLDGQRAGSVLYVSSGSLAAMDADEFLEVACGLAESRHPFLWVVRPNQVVRRGRHDSDTDTAGDEGVRLLDGGAEEAVREGRGVVVWWAPQREVLAHRAVGGFWTHCGWNSTLEAVGEGVPMICTPGAVDQMMNARYVQDVWGVGFKLEREELERGRIRDAIRKLMSGRVGDESRRRAQELRAKVAACCLDSSAGSSQIAMEKLVHYILSL